MQQNEPPRRLSSELVQLDHGLKQIERAQHPGLQRAPDSLPVLEAFQGFLESERRKARVRLLTLFVTAMVLILIVSGGAVAVILKTSGDLQGRVAHYAIESKALATEVAAAREKATASLQGFETRLDTVQTEVQAGLAEAMRLSASNNVPLELPQAYHEAMAALQEDLDAMRQANVDLAGALEHATNQWAAGRVNTIGYGTRPSVEPIVAASPVTEMPLPERLPAIEPSPETGPAQVATASTQGQYRASGTSMTLLISPPGDSTPVKWRLPTIQE